MSTINLTYYQVLDATVQNPDEESFWQKTKQAFASGWDAVGEVLVGIFYIWPLILFALLVAWFVKRNFRKKKLNVQ